MVLEAESSTEGRTLENAIVTLHASSNGGGGIYSSGTLTLRSTTLSHNGTSTGGGGVYNRGGPLNIINSTIDHNAADSGGGIFNFDSDLVVINSTISLNSVTGDGGGIYNAHNGTANVYNSIIVFNGVDSDRDGGSGGGVYNDPFSPFNLRNSIVAANDVGNTPIYDECTGELNSYGRNLFGADTGCTIKTVTGSWTSLNSFATLGQLQDNGGPTFTVALLAGSNAIDGGDPRFWLCRQQQRNARDRPARPGPRRGRALRCRRVRVQCGNSASTFDQLSGTVVPRARRIGSGVGHQFRAPGGRHIRDMVHLRRQRQGLVADHDGQQDGNGCLHRAIDSHQRRTVQRLTSPPRQQRWWGPER